MPRSSRLAACFLALSALGVLLGCGGGGGSSVQTPPPPPPVAPPDPPKNLKAQLEVKPNESGVAAYVHITWDSSPSVVDQYEIQISYSSPMSTKTVSVNSREPNSIWVMKGAELAPIEIKARSTITYVPSAWTPPVIVVPGPTAPRIRASFEEEGNSPRAIQVVIEKNSVAADAARILRAEGTHTEHGDWTIVAQLPYGANTNITYSDSNILELHNYIYQAINLKGELAGDPSYPFGNAYVQIFNPDPFVAEVNGGTVDITWQSRSKIGLTIDLFRVDIFSGGLGPGVQTLLSSGLDTRGWKDIPYQPGYFFYYLKTSLVNPDHFRYSSVEPIRYFGNQSWPSVNVNEALLEMDFPWGIPGGNPSGPWYWFMGIDDHLELYTFENQAWKTVTIPSIQGVVRPGVRIDQSGTPYIFIRKIPGSQDPPDLQTMVYAYFQHGQWLFKTISQWNEYQNPGWIEGWSQSIGPDGNFVLVQDVRETVGGYLQPTRNYFWNENGVWNYNTSVFEIPQTASYQPQNLQITSDGRWIQTFKNANISYIFTSRDQGNTWVRSEITTVGTQLLTVAGREGEFFNFSIRRVVDSPMTGITYELLCTELKPGSPEVVKHVLYYNHTGYALSLRYNVHPITGQVALLADPSSGLTIALQDASGAWKLYPGLPGELRMADRLDTCLFSWDGDALALLADYYWSNEFAKYIKVTLNPSVVGSWKGESYPSSNEFSRSFWGGFPKSMRFIGRPWINGGPQSE